MKAPREWRRWYNAMRARQAKHDRAKGKRPNGGAGWMDDPSMDRLLANSKHAKRHRRAAI